MTELLFGGPISEMPPNEQEQMLEDIAQKVLEVLAKNRSPLTIPEITREISDRTSLSQKEVTFGIQYGVSRGWLHSGGPIGPLNAVSEPLAS